MLLAFLSDDNAYFACVNDPLQDEKYYFFICAIILSEKLLKSFLLESIHQFRLQMFQINLREKFFFILFSRQKIQL
jgi:hypothetical protein